MTVVRSGRAMAMSRRDRVMTVVRPDRARARHRGGEPKGGGCDPVTGG